MTSDCCGTSPLRLSGGSRSSDRRRLVDPHSVSICRQSNDEYCWGNSMTLASRAHSTKRETISRLLAMAEREFGAKGLEGARVDDIARAAGVTKQLVYNYYRSKDELFASLLDEASAQAMSEMVALKLDHLDPPQALRAFLNCHFDQYRRFPLLGLTVMEENLQHGLHISSRNKFPELMPPLVAKVKIILERGTVSG